MYRQDNHRVYSCIGRSTIGYTFVKVSEKLFAIVCPQFSRPPV